ncbi:putative Zn finger-like uncharacterized protein [Rhodanobacter sp. ANJX3]|uniref:zinc-ribbon and DUF3426 domain-containing protein n=1 Tax=unclassified Rhodanobacter TaxID=2621553 RepID=UPI0015CDD1E1|nr:MULTISPECIES: zinc-ribbon and DUF3426 domain-containing protein [unclassified Rhodanobacter]MBB5359281.1 putative Zn finger-like uncharacterized protein [Rhodanobacter sp. ANJX3]NYE29967.1 putative Zn finger-like uncharacterized protein [Rhodanobacter sp. K2T2]
MYTQCPECLSVFSLDAHTLAQAHGHVVCGHCDTSFDSIATLTEQLPPEPFRELPINDQAYQPPRIDLVVYRPQPLPPAVIDAVVTDQDAALEPATSEEDFSQLVFAPRFVRQKVGKESRRSQRRANKQRARGERHWPWVVAGLLLLLGLGAQLAWAKRELLIRDPVVGGWLREACSQLGCELPLVAAPQQLRLLASNVQAHPSVSGALMISASVRNDAIFAQPFPVLTVTLSDAQGQRIAMRRLQPREYLDDTTILRHGLAPGASAALLLEVEDPGDKAVAFEFGFE